LHMFVREKVCMSLCMRANRCGGCRVCMPAFAVRN
jgi:hypothetical protein